MAKYILESYSTDPGNKLNLIPFVRVFEDDGITPVIEPTTGKPLILSNELKAHDQSEELLSARITAHNDALAIRKQLESEKPTSTAAMDAIIQAGGEIDVLPAPDPALEAEKRYAFALINFLQQLRVIAPPDDAERLSVEAEVFAIYAAHPEYFGTRPTPPKP